MPRKREPLVCEYLERVHREALGDYSGLLKSVVTSHGVYALYKKNKLYYVGLAKNLHSRVWAHTRDRHAGKWDHFSIYSTINNRHKKELESLILRIIPTSGNSQRGKFAKAVNLQKVFRKQLRNEHRRKVARLLGRKAPVLNESSSVRRARESGNRFAGLVDRTRDIRGKYKGERHKARLRPDGTVRMVGKAFGTPTDACEAATGRRYNGWYFWRIEQAPGRWVRLRDFKGR